MNHETEHPGQRLRRNEWDAHAATREQVRIGYEQLDADTFEQFLLLPDVDLADPALIDTFLQRYVGTYTSVDDAAYYHLERQGWITAGSVFLAADANRSHRPRWDWERITADLHQRCHVIERDEGVHVFKR